MIENHGAANLFAVTANHLIEGGIVYLRREGSANIWESDLTRATTVAKDAGAALLAAAETDIESNKVIEVYLIELTPDLTPVSTRERIRASGGPSVLYGAAENAKV